MGRVHVFCFLACYIVVFAIELSRLLGRNRVSRVLMLGFALAGLVAHTAYLLARSQKLNLPPLLSSSQDWFLVLAWLSVVSYFFLAALDPDLAVGVFLMPLVLICISAAYFVSDNPNTRLNALRGWKMLHASLLVLGMLGVIVGFVLAMMYLVQQHRLKQRHTLQTGFRIPSLEKLARLNRWAIIISVPLLTLGMGTGVGLGLYAQQESEPIQFTDPVIVGSGLVWLGMVVLFVWLVSSRHPPGKQVASLTLWAGGFLLLTLIGLQVLTGKHVFRSWHVTVGPVSRFLDS